MKDVNKFKSLPTSNSTTDHQMKFKPDKLNTFFACSVKPEENKSDIDETKITASSFNVNEEIVFKQLKTLNARKGA